MDKGTRSHSSFRKKIKKDWGKTFLEVGKWAMVVWLLWPLGRPDAERLTVVRVVAGVCLFVIFTGKLFYDVMIMDIVRQKRASIKQDIITLIAAAAIIAVLVGCVLVLIGLFIMKWAQGTGSPISS